MSGARRMQELKYFGDGATVVISLDGFNWLSKRRRSDKEVKNRNEELQLLISSGHMIRADEELQAISCIHDQRASAAPELWRNSDRTSSSPTRPPLSSASAQHRCHHSTLTSLASWVSERPKEAQWTRLILNMQDIFGLIQKDTNMVTQQDSVTANQHNRFIVFCDEDIPLQRFGDIYAEGCRTSKGDTGWRVSDNNTLSDLKNVTAHRPNNSNGNQHEVVNRDGFNNVKSLLKSCHMYGAPGAVSARDTGANRRKSVTFDGDVTVYLFDQESPTMELHAEACTSLPDVPLEDSGLEWEDDFSALEKNCHFQCVRHSQQHSPSLATQSTAALSRRFFLSQTCLFLTHVTESDLEL